MSTMARPILVVTNDSTNSEIAEAITHLGHTASREFPVVGTDEKPTPWDKRHAAINELLDMLTTR